jgi:HEAT repeat protein
VKTRKRTPETAAELMARLRSDPEWVRQDAEREARRRALEERLAEDERPLVQALNGANVSVESVWDLVNTREPYPRAIPVLIEHLSHPYPFRVREGIARALTVKGAGEAAYRELVSEFKNLPYSTDPAQHGFKWALGNAISIAANKSHFNDVVELIRDKRHGTTRDMMVLRLPSLDRKRAVDVLIESLADDDISGHAVMALGKLKVQRARPQIERALAYHPQAWVRKEAKKALAKLTSEHRSGRGWRDLG